MKRTWTRTTISTAGHRVSMPVILMSLLFVLFGCAKVLSAAGRANLLYIETNNPATGQNAVLGYTRNADGSLTDLPGSPFFTNGTGYRNTNEIIGPDDTDGELVLSPDHLFLFAVNEGSNDVSVFEVRLDGTLRLVPGSPFASGGKFPTSLAWQNGYLYVANRGDGILPTAAAPTYTPGTKGATNFSVFSIAGNGALTLQPTMTLEVPDGSSPGQIVNSSDGQFLWGLVPFYPTNNPPADIPPAGIFPEGQSRLLSFSVDEDDGAMNNAGPEVFLPPATPLLTVGGVFKGAFMLGMRPHPTQSILYVNSLLASVLTVWTWNQNGELSFVEAVDPGAVGRGGGPCWTALDPAARYAYTASVVTDDITAFSLANPMAPVALQNLVLGGPKGPLPAGTPEPYQSTTAPFNLAIDPTATYVYVSNHATCVTTSVDSVNCPIGNAIHVLKINSDGTLTEQPNSPFIYPPEVEPTNARPKGLIVL